VVELCPKPEDIDDELAHALFEGPHSPTLRRAMSGTTFTGALIDGEKQNMWVVGLGDSSAGKVSYHLNHFPLSFASII
jgi:hypothetical protein